MASSLPGSASATPSEGARGREGVCLAAWTPTWLWSPQCRLFLRLDTTAAFPSSRLGMAGLGRSGWVPGAGVALGKCSFLPGVFCSSKGGCECLMLPPRPHPETQLGRARIHGCGRRGRWRVHPQPGRGRSPGLFLPDTVRPLSLSPFVPLTAVRNLQYLILA